MIRRRIAYRASRIRKVLASNGVTAAFGFAVQQLANDIHGALHRLGVHAAARDGLVLREIHGSRMYLSVADPGLSRWLLRYGTREPTMTRLIQDEIKPGMVGIDIGANLGYYALLESRLVGGAGRIFAIEPLPENVAILRKNAEINSYRHLSVHACAVSDVTGQGTLFHCASSNLGTMLSAADERRSADSDMTHSSRAAMEVPVVALDDFVVEQRIGRIDFIRMDIEGFEITATRGMRKTFLAAQNPLKLFIEVHNREFTDPASIVGPWLRELFELGFRPAALATDSRVEWGLDASAFVDAVCSYRRSCPHIFLVKDS